MKAGIRGFHVKLKSISKPRALASQTTTSYITLQWRHNGPHGVSSHQPHHCLLNRVFRRRSKKTSKRRVTGLCVGNSPLTGEFPHKWPVTRKMFPFDDVILNCTLFSTVVLCLCILWWINVLLLQSFQLEACLIMSDSSNIWQCSRNPTVSLIPTGLHLVTHICACELRQHWFKSWLYHYLN